MRRVWRVTIQTIRKPTPVPAMPAIAREKKNGSLCRISKTKSAALPDFKACQTRCRGGKINPVPSARPAGGGCKNHRLRSTGHARWLAPAHRIVGQFA
jgi:hypothetical protein